jgi:hypothetical protein
LSTRTYSRSLEHRERRGVGGRPADAELFHPLDERGLRVARRRLGEVLRRPRSGASSAGRRRSWPAAAGSPRPRRRRPCPPGRGAGSRRTSRPAPWRAGRGGAACLSRGRRGRRCRRWCAPAPPIPSGSPACGSRSVRRAGPARARGTGRPAGDGGPCPSGGWPRAPPGRSSAWRCTCAVRSGRRRRRTPCRWCGGSRRRLPARGRRHPSACR